MPQFQQSLDRYSSNTVVRNRSPLKFFLLVFVLSIPFYLFGALTEISLSPDLPVSALMVVAPATAAAILAYRATGSAGVIELLSRSFDYKRAKVKVWYALIVLLKPGIVVLSWTNEIHGVTSSKPTNPSPGGLGDIRFVFIAALGEELGWSGYVIDPMQVRWNAFQASILLGLFWAVWHFVPLMQMGRSPAWIAWWSLATVATRVLMVWLYNNTGKSVFAMVLYHAIDNLVTAGPFLMFTSYNAQRFIGLITALTAAIVTVAWGPRTLTRCSNS